MKMPESNAADLDNYRVAQGARSRWLKSFAGALVVALFITAAFQRNFVWDTKLSLWSDAAEKSPRKSRPHNNLGNCYMLLARPFEAIEEYKIAIALDPRNIDAYYNLGLNFENVGILNQAVYYYDIFCRFAPPGHREQMLASCGRAQNLLRGMKVTSR